MASVKVHTIVKVDGKVAWEITRRHELTGLGIRTTSTFDADAPTTAVDLVNATGGITTLRAAALRAEGQTIDLGFDGDSVSAAGRIQVYPSGYFVLSNTNVTASSQYKGATAGGRVQGYLDGTGSFT